MHAKVSHDALAKERFVNELTLFLFYLSRQYPQRIHPKARVSRDFRKKNCKIL
jgi:hypothetical protein